MLHRSIFPDFVGRSASRGRFVSAIQNTKMRYPYGYLIFMVRVTGVEGGLVDE
jgi:hypothetical protein